MAARKLKRSEQLPDSSGWELLVRLAQGGMGAVFLGTRRGTREPLYAIKRAHAHLLEEPEFRKMFTAEAQLALQIQHPHAIGVRAVDESDGELLLIMDYFEGSSLGELLTAADASGSKLPTGVVLRIVLDAARGLDAAHRLTNAHGQPLGIVHRDISPQNILVGVGGVSAIVDFGVAKAAAVEATRTATEILKGKTAYMAPEYLKERVANPQTDVFSLGVVAWEALANRRLFKREDEVATLQAIAGAEPAPMLVDIMPFDATLSAILARALVKGPRQRYLSARDFADALEARATAAELLATRGEVAAAMKRLMGETLEERRSLVESALAQRFGAVDTTASKRRTGAMPIPHDSDRGGTTDRPGSSPFQIIDTTRRRAITTPQGPTRSPIGPVGHTTTQLVTIEDGAESVTMMPETLDRVTLPRTTGPQEGGYGGVFLPQGHFSGPTAIASPPNSVATLQRPTPRALLGPVPQETVPLRAEEIYAAFARIDRPKPTEDVPLTGAAIILPAGPSGLARGGAENNRHARSAKIAWGLGAAACIAAATGIVVSLLGPKPLAAPPAGSTAAVLEAPETPSAAPALLAVEAPPRVASTAPPDPPASTRVTPTPSTPRPNPGPPIAQPTDKPKPVPKPPTSTWRPKTNPYNN
jgi:serine/threonine protein kinase